MRWTYSSAGLPSASRKLPSTRDSSILSSSRWKSYRSVSRSDQACVMEIFSRSLRIVVSVSYLSRKLGGISPFLERNG